MFQAPRSTVDFSFWESLHRLKLDKFRLDSSFVALSAVITPAAGKDGPGGSLHVDGKSFGSSRAVDNGSLVTRGAFLNVNTVEEFQKLNKKALVEAAGQHIWGAIFDGSAIQDPSILFSFVLVTFADLKKHVFTYWFAFPALVPASQFAFLSPPIRLKESTAPHRTLLGAAYSYLRSGGVGAAVFALTRAAATPAGELPDNTFPWVAHSIAEVSLQKSSVLVQDIVFVVVDAAASAAADAPGWVVRNVLALLSVRGLAPNGHSDVLCLRGSHMQDGDAAGKYIYSELFKLYAKDQASPTAFEFKTDVAFSSPTVVGWEPNDRGKPGPRVSDLGAVMNSEKLMEQAVDLNVRLMKWRQWPSLDTESLSGLKCLLLGAGTLGCATARALMGWGIRHITLVDNGRVSYSNPARQSLFEFEDAENKAFKSVAAAQRLKKIFPGMVTTGHVLTIAMPGHPIDAMEETSAQKSFEELRDLVASHDVVYALTDSREARWLPSVLCAAMDKLLINSALGFSSYLVMRHGGAPLGSAEKSRPGCYFCNDVVAPVDSMKDRSLDQQCTVTRPGLALIAGGLASELTVALMNSPHKLHHPLPAFRRAGDTDFAENSDEIPHQIRGSLNNFTQACPVTPSFAHCTACSGPVVEAFKTSGYDFVRSVCTDSSVLERISGITALNETISDELLASMEMDSDEDM
ncbi:unnamed protein product, partial [Ectocarpus fasciculatus]